MTRYDEARFAWMLPAWMRGEPFDAALAGVVDEMGAEVAGKVAAWPTWGHIGELGEPELDALAADMAIAWYDAAADVESKRAIVANARKIQSRLGTKWALEEVLRIYYDEAARVVEWFDYGAAMGPSGHFSIEADYDAGTADATRRFLAIVGDVKSAGTVLDDVAVVARSRASCAAAAHAHSSGTSKVEAVRSKS